VSWNIDQIRACFARHGTIVRQDAATGADGTARFEFKPNEELLPGVGDVETEDALVLVEPKFFSAITGEFTGAILDAAAKGDVLTRVVHMRFRSQREIALGVTYTVKSDVTTRSLARCGGTWNQIEERHATGDAVADLRGRVVSVQVDGRPRWIDPATSPDQSIGAINLTGDEQSIIDGYFAPSVAPGDACPYVGSPEPFHCARTVSPRPLELLLNEDSVAYTKFAFGHCPDAKSVGWYPYSCENGGGNTIAVQTAIHFYSPDGDYPFSADIGAPSGECVLSSTDKWTFTQSHHADIVVNLTTAQRVPRP
jgi:hypothetical protein